jgi:hypothetical protein
MIPRLHSLASTIVLALSTGALLGTAASCSSGGGSTPTDAGNGDHPASGDGATAQAPADAADGASGHTVSFTFDDGLDGFVLNPFQGTNPGDVVNIGAPRTSDAGTGDDGATANDGAAGGSDAGAGAIATLDIDRQDGNPLPGSLKVVAPFTDYNQIVDVTLPLNGAFQNWSGKTLHAKVRLTSGAFNGGAIIYVQTTLNYTFYMSLWTALPLGRWQSLTFDLSGISTADQVIAFGIQIGTGAAPDGGAAYDLAAPTFNIDTITD